MSKTRQIWEDLLDMTSYLPWGPELLKTLKVHTRWQVAARCCGNTSQQQIALCALENFCENFFSAKEFCHHNKLHKFSLIWLSAICCGNKILWQRQRFSLKFSSTHQMICHCDRCNMLLQLVAVTDKLRTFVPFLCWSMEELKWEVKKIKPAFPSFNNPGL